MNYKYFVQIKTAINEVFGIRCPASIQKTNAANTFAVFDYENECQFDEKKLIETAFCGQCARKNPESLFTNLKAPFTFTQVNIISFYILKYLF